MKKISVGISLLITFFQLNVNTVAAETINTGIGKINTEPKELASDVLRIALGVAAGVAFLLIVYAGFKLVFSQGNPDNVKAGQEMITSAIVGLLIIVFATFILRLIGIDILGLPI